MAVQGEHYQKKDTAILRPAKNVRYKSEGRNRLAKRDAQPYGRERQKPFHEVILQIGNREDMNAQTEDGALAAKVLDEYMQSFQARNPNLRVFSAHLHMDEATPHLHIDFVPFTTGSKRSLETRVSLKQALAAQGLEIEVKEYRQVQKYLGPDKAQDLIQRALADLEAHKRLRRKREEYER